MLTALATAVVAALASLAPGEAAASKPSIGLADQSPITVTGRGFEGSERVVVKLVGDGTERRKTVVANQLGRFTVRWPGAALPQCGPYTVSAAGSRGSRAMLRRMQIPPACGIVQQP